MSKALPPLLAYDLAGLRDVLSAAGYEVRDDKPIEGFDRFFTADPFGNRIELLQRK